MSRPEPSAADARAHRRDRGDADGCCCHDACNGLPNGPACRGNADNCTDTTAADHCPPDAFNAYTISYLTNRDTGDENPHV
jgi:hypothetical protein